MSFFATMLFFYIVYDMFRTNFVIRKNNPHTHYETSKTFLIPNPEAYRR